MQSESRKLSHRRGVLALWSVGVWDFFHHSTTPVLHHSQVNRLRLAQDGIFPFGIRQDVSDLDVKRCGPSTIGLPMDLAMDLSMP